MQLLILYGYFFVKIFGDTVCGKSDKKIYVVK